MYHIKLYDAFRATTCNIVEKTMNHKVSLMLYRAAAMCNKLKKTMYNKLA